jgi:hypothetical protein
MMFLIQDNTRTETFQVATSLFSTAIYIGLLATRFDKWGGLSVIAWDFQNKEEVFLQPKVRLFVTIPELGWLFVVVLLSVAAPVALYIWGRVKNDESKYLLASRTVFVSIALQAVALAAFILRARNGFYPSGDAEGLFQTSLAASPFILSGLVSSIFASLLYLMMVWRRRDLERLLPTSDSLDRITYKTICIAFPLLARTGRTAPGDPIGVGILRKLGRQSPGSFTAFICTPVLPMAGVVAAPPTSPSLGLR